MSTIYTLRNKRRGPHWLALAAIGILGSLIAINLFGRPLYRVGPLDMRLAVLMSVKGKTIVSLPPLGSLEAATHSAPIAVKVQVENARIDDLKQLLIDLPKKKVIEAQIRSEARSALLGFFVRLLALAFGGGFVAVAIVFGIRRSGRALAVGLANAGLLAALLGITLSTYHIDALHDAPTYRGGLRGAPWIVKLLGAGVMNIGEVDSGVRDAAESISDLEKHISALDGAKRPESEHKILLISDIHNNTIGISFAAELARRFDVDLTLNAGDLTDLGTHFEAALAEQVSRISGPHVFATGNHDSPTIINALRHDRRSVVPNGKSVRVAGFEILAVNDPASRHTGVRSVLPTRSEIEAAKRDLRTTLRRLPHPPDILLVHSNKIGQPFVGKVPVVVWGHTHSIDVQQKGAGVGLNPGSTGASGVRIMQAGSSKSMSAIILYVSKHPTRAIAADIIELRNPWGGFTVTRRKF